MDTYLTSVVKAAIMSKSLFLCLALLLCTTFTAAAAGKHPAEMWSFYHFDGTAFTSGPAVDGSAFIAVREKLRPVVMTSQTHPIEQTALPDGTGVIAGICYLSSSGGKLGTGPAFTPYPRVPLLISTGGKQLVTVQTDDNGYFLVILATGTYSVGSGPFTAEISVERGITTLVPLRAGKRMVD